MLSLEFLLYRVSGRTCSSAVILYLQIVSYKYVPRYCNRICKRCAGIASATMSEFLIWKLVKNTNKVLQMNSGSLWFFIFPWSVNLKIPIEMNKIVKTSMRINEFLNWWMCHLKVLIKNQSSIYVDMSHQNSWKLIGCR